MRADCVTTGGVDVLLIQGLTGLAGAASLFLVAAGLTVIFGVTRVVNFAHGSLCMLGAYIGWSILARLPGGPGWFALGVLATALATAGLGVLLEVTLLRRIYRAPELFQLLATFGVVLIVQDLTPWLWGPNDLSLPRPPWLRAFVSLGGERFPRYDLALIAIGPVVLGLLWLLLRRTRFGVLIRAATEDRDMAAALGIDQKRLFTAVFALGSGLAGLAGVLALPDASANPQIDLAVVVDAFVVVVVGGLGSVTGAFLASLLIGELHAFGIVLLPQATLVLVFVVMAAVLILRPNGLLGAAPPSARPPAGAEPVIRPAGPGLRLAWAIGVAAAVAAPFLLGPYPLAILTEALIAMLFAFSLHLMMGFGGMPSFGHAAWFGLGAYAAALVGGHAGMPIGLLAAPLAAGLAAAAFGLFVVRLSGVYLAMLTLAFAQIVWGLATQWSGLTGGDDGILGVWPSPAVPFYWVVLTLAGLAVWALHRCVHAPFGFALRAVRDCEPRGTAIALWPDALRAVAFTLSGSAAGLAGGLFAYAKGSVFPGYAGIGRSVDALLMVLLGGVQTVSGPILGAFVYTGLYDGLLQTVPFWRLTLGLVIVALVVWRPQGLAGGWRRASPPRVPPLAWPRTAPAAAPAAVAVRPAGAPLLVAEGLRKDYGGIQAVADVSLRVAPGEVVALIGPNGAGKSTCFNLLNGQVRPDAGRVRLGGLDITNWPARRIVRLGVGRSFQVAAVFRSMTVRENVQTALLAHHRRIWRFWRAALQHDRAAADGLLELVGLGALAEEGCATLAYGDAKRLELALALANDPRLLLMDEPAAGLAAHERAALMALVRRLARERGCAVLFTEHDVDLVFAVADRVLVMDRGVLIAQGDPVAVRADPAVRAAYLGSA
jgi:branched-chain amino acid transport system permease protein